MNENKLYAMNIMVVQPAIRDNKRAVDGNCFGDGIVMNVINKVESRKNDENESLKI